MFSTFYWSKNMANFLNIKKKQKKITEKIVFPQK